MLCQSDQITVFALHEDLVIAQALDGRLNFGL
jgi:hypothetical protein